MLINGTIHPEQNIYLVGGRLIKLLKEKGNGQDFMTVFELYNKPLKENGKVSLNTFLLSLDWLFLLGILDIKNNKIILGF